MKTLIIHCMSATTIAQVDELVRINIEALEKFPALRVFPANAYARIKNIEKQRNLNTETIWKN